MFTIFNWLQVSALYQSSNSRAAVCYFQHDLNDQKSKIILLHVVFLFGHNSSTSRKACKAYSTCHLHFIIKGSSVDVNTQSVCHEVLLLPKTPTEYVHDASLNVKLCANTFNLILTWAVFVANELADWRFAASKHLAIYPRRHVALRWKNSNKA